MPIKRSYKKRGAAKKKVGYRRRRYAPRIRNQRVNDFAGVSETRDLFARNTVIPSTALFSTLDANSGPPGSQVLTMTDLTLGNFARSSAIAQGYQYYRVKYLEVKVLPSADTFAPGTGKPYFYYMIDKGNSLPLALTQFQMKALGAKPIVLDEKPIVIRWKPGVQLSTEISTTSGTTSAQKYQVSPWLNTDEDPNNVNFQPSQVVHNGLKFFAENIGGASYNYKATITAHIQFKKPSIPATAFAPGEQ